MLSDSGPGCSEQHLARPSITSGSNDTDGLNKQIRKELLEAVFAAMGKLKLKHRNILVLRCFEQMPYSEIATIMDCSKLQTRVLFFRAKHSLKQRLSRKGFGKEFLLTSLGLFGLITTHTKAASATSTITAGLLEVGPLATLIGAAGTKLGIAVTSLIAAITLTFTLKTFVCLSVFLCLVLLCLTLVCLTGLYN